jgi:hypothetical protein
VGKKVTDQEGGDHMTRFLHIYYFVLHSPSLSLNNEEHFHIFVYSS